MPSAVLPLGSHDVNRWVWSVTPSYCGAHIRTHTYTHRQARMTVQIWGSPRGGRKLCCRMEDLVRTQGDNWDTLAVSSGGRGRAHTHTHGEGRI